MGDILPNHIGESNYSLMPAIITGCAAALVILVFGGIRLLSMLE
ncbi:hypothetical protein [Streptosporangium sp. KLBMP 9127]